MCILESAVTCINFVFRVAAWEVDCLSEERWQRTGPSKSQC